MFEAFQPAGGQIQSRRRLAFSATAAVGVYAVLGAMALVIGGRAVVTSPEREVEVSFEKARPRLPPPPPPPPPKVIQHRPRVVAPAAAPAAPPPRPLEAPREIPKEAPPEEAPGTGPAAAPIGAGSPGGVTGGVAGGTGEPAQAIDRAQPVNLPEEATPPVPSTDNAPPTYPEVARSTGQEGLVILKVVITAEGRVGTIRVLKGDAPFVEAAIAAVRNHRYTPATLDGKAIAVYRILKIPFRLSLGG